MNLTIGFIAFFISIVIPGIIFRRFYFYGEFSKQFNAKDPVLHSIYFSIIPGIVLQLLCVLLFNLLVGFESSYLDVFTIFKDITSDNNKETQELTKNFIDDDIITFFLYTLFVVLISSFLGWSTSRLIRLFKWDKKYKLFRFKNQWYYIFSGELLNLKKFKEAHKEIIGNNNKSQDQDVLMTFADILVSVSESNDRKELYTGYVVDYDLRSDDASQLDRVYLIDTYRYKKIENQSNNNKEDIKKPLVSRNRLKVPGDVFVLKANRIVNINLTYVPSLKKKIEKQRKEFKKQIKYRWIQIIYFLVLIMIILIHFFYRGLNLDETFLGDYFTDIGIFGKILSIVFLNQVLSNLIPVQDKNQRLEYDYKSNIWSRIIMFLIFGSLFYYYVLSKLI